MNVTREAASHGLSRFEKYGIVLQRQRLNWRVTAAGLGRACVGVGRIKCHQHGTGRRSLKERVHASAVAIALADLPLGAVGVSQP